MGKTLLETLIGAVVLVVAIAFITMAYTRSDVKTVKGYTVLAQFTAIDGLNVGDDVRISGIKVGSVTDQTLDYDYFRAIVHMSIDPAVELPEDTTAAVVSEGLLGGKYVALEPGGDDELITDGGEITLTQSSVNLESLLGKFIYSGSSSGGGSAQ
ncbi:MAG: outer membrane lipid asymmetry maintenance protein MlaD [Alphaproteobacteria bacterium]